MRIFLGTEIIIANIIHQYADTPETNKNMQATMKMILSCSN